MRHRENGFQQLLKTDPGRALLPPKILDRGDLVFLKYLRDQSCPGLSCSGKKLQLKQHWLTHSIHTLPGYACLSCQKSFLSPQTLKNHEKTHAPK